MAQDSRIEWTQTTWNPVTGCSKVSPGCAHCYAEAFAERWRGVPGHAYERGFDLQLRPERLEQPLHWRKPRVVFVNSMSDLFHEAVPEAYIQDVFAVMTEASAHVFQVLTKRAARLAELARDLAWPPNVWVGVSIENRRFTDRANDLRAVPAAVRFISAEPLLGPLEGLDLDDIDWLIAGGESGPGARRMRIEWARELRDLCSDTGTAFFLKQLGGHPDKRGGERAILDGKLWREMPRRVASLASGDERRRWSQGPYSKRMTVPAG